MLINFKGKRVTLVGLGQYKFGSGLSAAKFLLEQGAKLTITDLKTQEQLSDSFKELEKFGRKLQGQGLRPSIKYVWGKHRPEDFVRADWILRNPQVPNRSKFLDLARQHKIPIDTDVSLFLRLCPARVLGVTGTRGKSTTTALIYEMIKRGLALRSTSSAANNRGQVFLGGNILYSPLNFLDKVRSQDWVVLELSSWQTESFAPFKISPHISVITNLYPDHMNTYKGMKDYALAKEEIFKWQKADDFAVLNWDNQYTRSMGRRVLSRRYWFSLSGSLALDDQNSAFVKGSKIFLRSEGRLLYPGDLRKIKLFGLHNHSNILAAATAAYLAGVKLRDIAQAIQNFPGLPNRLELIAEFSGIKFYNDTTATTAEGTIAALKSFPAKKIILIAGGSEKNLPFRELAREIIRRVKALVLLDDKASFRIAQEITSRQKDFSIFWAADMDQAVWQAGQLARPGNVVLMSPACASFGLFRNEFDRGEKFVKAVKKLAAQVVRRHAPKGLALAQGKIR